MGRGVIGYQLSGEEESFNHPLPLVAGDHREDGGNSLLSFFSVCSSD